MKRLLIVLAACGSAAPPAPPPPPLAPPLVPAAPPAPVELVRAGSIAAGDRHACAVLATGRVACWGSNASRELGVAGPDATRPVEVPGLEDVAGIVAGRVSSCAWTARGAALCWGVTGRASRVTGLDDIVQIVIEYGGACGLHRTGRVACWQHEAWTDPLWPAPQDLDGIDGAVEIAGGPGNLCARTATGVRCAQMQPNMSNVPAPETPVVDIPELAGALSIAAYEGAFAALLPGGRLARFSLGEEIAPAIADHVPGTRVVMGARATCTLGGPAPGTTCWHDDKPAGDTAPNLRDLALGAEVSCGRVDDRVVCWGKRGLLGDGEDELPAAPLQVKGIADARQLELENNTACVLRASGRVACWGDRKDGIDVEPVELDGAADATELAMSWSRVCALRPHGRVTCWKLGEREPFDAPELAKATRLLSGSKVCGVLPGGTVSCEPVTFAKDWDPAPGLTANLPQPCAARDAQVECFHGPGPITWSSPVAVCNVVGGGVKCHYAHDPARVFDELPTLHDVVSFDGTFVVRADGTVTTRAALAGVPRDPRQPPVSLFAQVAELRPGGVMTCARHTDGTASCWGQRDHLGAGQAGTAASPAQVAGALLGAARPYLPSEPRPAPTPPPAGPPIRLRGVAMTGPFADRAAACSVLTCAGDRVRVCGHETMSLPMARPPAPFTEIGMMSITCANPEYRRGTDEALRLVAKRADGYWVGAPLVAMGGDRHCDGYTEPRWEVRDLVRGGNPEVVLSLVAGTRCAFPNGNESNSALALVTAIADGARPVAYAPILTGAFRTKLDAVFAPDGTFSVGGPATWLAPARGSDGAFATEAMGGVASAKPPLGTYRFE